MAVKRLNTVWCEVGEEVRRQGSFWGRDLGRRIDNERALIRARVCVFLRSSKQPSMYVDAWCAPPLRPCRLEMWQLILKPAGDD